jgi:hypothetical protein
MYFGLTNSPATFQTMMNEIFQDLITKGVVSVDNLYTTQTPECTKEKYNGKIKMKGSLLRSHQQPMWAEGWKEERSEGDRWVITIKM